MLKKMTKKIKNSVLQYGNNNISILKSQNVTVQQMQAMDQLHLYLQKGEVDKAVNLLRNMKDFMDSQHPVAPFWKYEIGVDDNGRNYMSHVPAYSGAEKEKPLRGTMKVVIPNHYKKFKNMKALMDFSYGSQQEIEFDVKSLKTWIGETLIEEFEANEKSETKVKFIPKKFPPPRPMKLYLKDNSWSIDYLQIGVEKMVDSLITLSNYHQKDAPLAVQLIMDISSTTAKFNITITEYGLSSVKNILKFQALVDKSQKSNKPNLALKLLEEDSDVIVGFNWDFSNNGKTEAEDYISFLKKIHYIEQEFNLEFKFQDKSYTNAELYFIDVVYNCLKNGDYKNKFKDSYVFTMDDQLELQKLFVLHDENSCLNVQLNPIGNDQLFILLGIKFKVVTYETYLENVKIENPERLRKKSELLDEGENLKVKFSPYNSESFISERIIVEPV